MSLANVHEQLYSTSQCDMGERAWHPQGDLVSRQSLGGGFRIRTKSLLVGSLIISRNVQSWKWRECSRIQSRPHIEATSISFNAACNGKGRKAVAVVDNSRPALERLSASQTSANGVNQSLAMALALEFETEEQS